MNSGRKRRTLSCAGKAAAIFVLTVFDASAANVVPAPNEKGQATNQILIATNRDLMLSFTADDGTPLEGKLTLPPEGSSPPPVVFHLHGAGPATYDKPFGYRDDEGQVQTGRYLDFHARELARRGIALFRMSKRGCTQQGDPPRMRVERNVFAKATPSVLLADYDKGLEALRSRPEIDARRIVLTGASEGTWLAPRLARRSPAGIVGIVMTAYAADNTRDVVVWQNTIGPWRNIQHLIPAARDGALTKDEYDAAAAREPGSVGALPFAVFDADTNGVINAQEVQRVVKPRLDAILKAVDERDDAFLTRTLYNLTSAYLLEDWTGEPTHVNLLALDIPLAIFHGELDGTTRVEGVRETEAAFRAAGRTNLTVRFYPDGNHDLNWTWRAARDRGPQAFQDAFDFIAQLSK